MAPFLHISIVMRQRTIRKAVKTSGIGLHSGKKVNLEFKPAPENTGIVFRRADKNYFPIKADVSYVSKLAHATNLTKDGISIATTEHLLATLIGLGIDNIYVDIDAEETPIMDGSASAFVYLLKEAGIKKQRAEKKYLRIKKPKHFLKGDRRISIYPYDGFKVTYTIEFDHPLIRLQTRTIELKNSEDFENEISPARTFGFLKDVEMLRKNGLALGGSLENAIVIDSDKILNGHLRFADEFVRHKILDVIGDLALLGYPILGHVVAYKAGHEIHTSLAKEIKNDRESYEIVNAGELDFIEKEKEATQVVEEPSAI